MEHAAEQARFYAERAGQERPHLFMLTVALIYGPRPVRDALARLSELATDRTHPFTMFDRAVLLAMSGEIDEARSVAAAGEIHCRDLGEEAVANAFLGDLEAIAGDHEAAAARLRIYCDYLVEESLGSLLSTYAPIRGGHLCALGRFDEAWELAEQGRELAYADDPVAQSLWRRVAALVRAHRGELEAAERLGHEAVAIAGTIDSPWFQGDALSDLAEVLDLAGRPAEAAAAYRDALDQYERKGIVPLAARVRDLLATRTAP
jgi:tetratricopeptide (TPR) repeat protein